MEQDMSDSYAVLVGWTSEDLGGRMVLRLETFDPQQPREPHNLARRNLFMTKDQALQLANYLLKVTGQSAPPAQRRGRLARWLGA